MTGGFPKTTHTHGRDGHSSGPHVRTGAMGACCSSRATPGGTLLPDSDSRQIKQKRIYQQQLPTFKQKHRRTIHKLLSKGKRPPMDGTSDRCKMCGDAADGALVRCRPCGCCGHFFCSVCLEGSPQAIPQYRIMIPVSVCLGCRALMAEWAADPASQPSRHLMQHRSIEQEMFDNSKVAVLLYALCLPCGAECCCVPSVRPEVLSAMCPEVLCAVCLCLCVACVCAEVLELHWL